MADIKLIARRVESMKHRAYERDTQMANILAVRQGKMVEIFPDMFPEGMSHAMVANFIDVTFVVEQLIEGSGARTSAKSRAATSTKLATIA